MNNYTVIVWYRFTVNGDIEKEMQDYNIKADTPENAISQALKKFKSHSAIPFKTECKLN